MVIIIFFFDDILYEKESIILLNLFLFNKIYLPNFIYTILLNNANLYYFMCYLSMNCFKFILHDIFHIVTNIF